MCDIVPALLGWGLYTTWPFYFSGRMDSCLGLETSVFWSSGSLRGSSDYSNVGEAVPSLRRQECCCKCHWPPLLTYCLYFRQKWTLRDCETHCKYICPSDRSEKRIDLHRAWIPAERTPVSNSCLFNPSIAGGNGGHVGERVFTFTSKTKHKMDLREERDIKFWGSGMVEYKCRGLSESCLKHLISRWEWCSSSWENEARAMVGCLFLASLQGLQNTNTPAPHSALVLFFAFFYLKFLIFEITV